jgi:hypothetical protein
VRIREEGRNIEPTFAEAAGAERILGDYDSRFRECRQNKADDTAKRSNQQTVAIRSSNFEFGTHETRGRHEKQFSELGRGGSPNRPRAIESIAPTRAGRPFAYFVPAAPELCEGGHFVSQDLDCQPMDDLKK